MHRFPTLVQACSAVAGLALLLGSGGVALRVWVQQEDHRAAQIMLAPLGSRGSVPERLLEATADQVAAIYHGTFHATVYYTPREDGFSAEAGFDMTPATKQGLLGKAFPRDFLKAVELEGFGRMKTCVEGNWYVRCCRGRWGYAQEPLDSNGQPLKALRSTAIGADHKLVRTMAKFRIKAENLPPSFQQAHWQICDTGGGLKPGQIDFYWGEDAPMGPGKRLTRPRGMPHPIVNPTVLVIR